MTRLSQGLSAFTKDDSFSTALLYCRSQYVDPSRGKATCLLLFSFWFHWQERLGLTRDQLPCTSIWQLSVCLPISKCLGTDLTRLISTVQQSSAGIHYTLLRGKVVPAEWRTCASIREYELHSKLLLKTAFMLRRLMSNSDILLVKAAKSCSVNRDKKIVKSKLNRQPESNVVFLLKNQPRWESPEQQGQVMLLTSTYFTHSYLDDASLLWWSWQHRGLFK